LRSDYREFQYCIPEARDGYNLGTASGSQISECLNPAVTRYVITWARFELCPRYKSPSSVTRRGASIGLTWLPNRPKPAFPPLLSGSRLGRVLGEGGVKLRNTFGRSWLSAVLRRWKEEPDAPQGLVWKGFTQYSCKVVLASPDMETKAEVFLSDGVIEGFVARGTTCVELNRRLEAARNSTDAEKASLQQFFKSFPARFAQMHGRFDIQWPGACGEQRRGQADAAAIDAGQPTTYGTVVAFEQQAPPSQQSG